MTTMRRAVFLDKEGTLVENVPYNADPARIRFTPGAGEAVQRLHAAGYVLALISNQSGVAHGIFPESALVDVEHRLRDLLARLGVPLAGFFYCPHHPLAENVSYRVRCFCRKPAPGLVLRAARALGVEPADSWMVGDTLDDVEAGRRAGCRTVLVNGGETESTPGLMRFPDYAAPDLGAAARLIVAHDQLRWPQALARTAR